MNKFLVEIPHTPEECVWALKRMIDAGPDFLNRFVFGCKDGVHVGWAVVDVDNKFAAQELVPVILRPKARIVGLNQFTPEEVRAFHEGQSSIASKATRPAALTSRRPATNGPTSA